MRHGPEQRGGSAVLDAVVADLALDRAGRTAGSPMRRYLQALVEVAATGRRLTRTELTDCEEQGGAAARDGVALAVVVERYTQATALAWSHLPRMAHADYGGALTGDSVTGMGSAVFGAMKAALAALASGYRQAHRDAVRGEHRRRREFIEDLLSGTANVGSLVERAERFDLHLAFAHVVAVGEAGEPFAETGKAVVHAEAALRSCIGSGDVLVSSHDGRLLAIVPARSPAPGRRTEMQLGKVLGEVVEQEATGSWRVGVGQPQVGPQGIFRSYRDSCEALSLAERLDLAERIVEARRLRLYRVLLRDAEAVVDLLESVLGPLVNARGGAEPLLETLESYFASGCVTAEVARKLHLTERAITYRFSRVHALTGYDLHVPAHRLALEVAVIGARYFDWPQTPLPSTASIG